MVISNEELWRTQTEGRLRIKKSMFVASLGLFSTLVLGVAYVTQPLIPKSGNLSLGTVDPSWLRIHVRTLSEKLSPRDESHPQNLDLVAEYIRQEFEKTSGRVTEQPFSVRGETYKNIIVQFGPETGERVVVGAHYDTAGPRPGADDNASGVAGLIELAKLLNRQTIPLCIELVAYTLEEPPNFRTPEMGSAVLAASLKREGVRVRAMFSLEMIGYFDDTADSQSYPSPLLSSFYPSRGNFIAVVGNLGEGLLVRRIKGAMIRASTLPVRSINAPAMISGIDFSDHLNYWNQGYPAVMITDTAFYRNHAYHSSEDTASKLDYRRMAMVVVDVFNAVAVVSR
jgi:hypothetical protein